MKSEIEKKLDYHGAVADWLIDLSDSCILGGAHDDAIKWIQLAADVLYSQNRDLSSPRIEASLRFFATLLPEPRDRPHLERVDLCGKQVCLHVLNQAFAFGGHTAMATRWMRQDGDTRVHSVALLDQKNPPPPELVQTVSATGGRIYAADPNASVLQRAAWLRALACDRATYVILHIDVNDVIAAIAFGSTGGPPVLLVNHAAHIFWVGAAVPDLVVNCRGSRLEEHWTKIYRGATACATIPIPLMESNISNSVEIGNPESKAQAKDTIGIPREAILILTVGASYKYAPLAELDFLQTCKGILEAVPEAFLLAAGVNEDARWMAASSSLGTRLRALGSVPQKQLALLHKASDLYIEGFPFGSTTALLEAGLQGVPVVLAPAECPPPFASDGVALDDTLQRPRSTQEYKAEIVRMCKNAFERATIGRRLQKAILMHHTGAGWKRYLTNALGALPPKHRVDAAPSPRRTPTASYEYWCKFRETWAANNQSALEEYISRALSSGLRPKITQEMKRACEDARQVRAGRAIPLPLLLPLCNHILPLLPISCAYGAFRSAEFLFRGGRLRRLRSKVRRLFWKAHDQQSPSEQYRHTPGRREWTDSANQATFDDRPDAAEGCQVSCAAGDASARRSSANVCNP